MALPWEEDYGDVATAETPPWEADYAGGASVPASRGSSGASPHQTEGDQLRQFEPPNVASRALEAARQYLSPILGRTAQQQMAEGPRDAEGLIPAASKPIIPLPKFTHSPDDSKPMAVGKAIGNTALGFAEFFESPLGIATAGAAAIPNAGRIIAGAFAADLGSKLPEAITTTRQTVANPAASFGEKAESVIGTGTQAALVGLTARHAAKGRAVNTEAANLEKEIQNPNTKAQTPEQTPNTKNQTPIREPQPWEMEYAGGEMPRNREFLQEIAEKAEKTEQTPNTKIQTPTESPAVAETKPTGQAAPVKPSERKIKDWSQDEWEIAVENMVNQSDLIGGMGGRAGRASYELTDLVQNFADFARAKHGELSVAQALKEFTPTADAPASRLRQLREVLKEEGYLESKTPKRETPNTKAQTPKTVASRWGKMDNVELATRSAAMVEFIRLKREQGEPIATEVLDNLTGVYQEAKRRGLPPNPAMEQLVKGQAETPAVAVAKVAEHVAAVATGKKAVPVAAVGTPPETKSQSKPKVSGSLPKAATTTGPRPAKEIKSELVQRLEEEISKLPPAPEFLYTDPKRVQGKREFYVVAKEGGQRLRVREGGNSGGWTIETEKLSGKTGLIERKVIGSATGDVRAATRTAESAMERVLSGEQPKITIEIPGDGTFTIERTHAALNEVLRRASALDTRSGTPAKKSGPPGDPPTPDTKGIRTSARRIIEEASSILDGIESGKFPGEVKALDWVRSLGNTRPAWATVIEDRVRIGPRHNFTLREAARDYLKSGTDLYKHAEQWDIINKPVESGTLEGWADKVLSEDPRKRTRMGLDPVEESRRLAAVAIKGSYIIARGVRDFAQWSAEIIKQIPELAAKGEAELRRLYARAVDIAEGRDPEIGLSVRGMKIKADTSLSDQVRENTEAAYTKRVAANDIAEAQRLVTAAGGPEKAANDILTGLWKPVDQTIQVKGAGEVLAGLAKLEKAAAEADPVRANELADLQVRVAEFTTRNATTPAQWLQAYNSLYANYSPAAWLKEWRNGIDSARQTRVERATGKPVGESPVEIAQGIADGVADTVRADAPKTAEVIQAVYGSKNTKTQTPNTKAQPPETMPEAIERILGQKGEQAQRTARKIKDFYEREVEKFKRRHKIPELSPEDQRAILAEAKAIERLPLDSLQRREAVLRLLDQLHRRKGFEWWELPIGFWYAHTLSGPTTHAKNILGNSVNLGMEAGLQSLLKPTNIPIILESLGRSLSVGGKEAWSILKTGHDTSARHGDKFELRRNVMELQNGTMDKVLLPWKLVGRFLRAEDAVFFNAGQELRAAILAKRANGESTAAARKAMGWTPEARTAAEAQAASEGLTGLNYQRRVNEIIEQGRAGEVMNAAREFGYDVTFNNEPYGVLGAFTSAINRGFDAAPVLKPFILPFTRIVANVSNSSLNWTPVGSYRALRAQRKLAWLGRAENNGKLYGRAINDPLAIRDAHARALLGTAAIVGITAAAVKNVFDDNPQFMVTGSGPANLDQRKALRAAGWIPYSVKVGDKYISYADKPPQIALAMVGHYLDAIRYKNLDREDALNRVNYALNGSFGVLLQSSWLQGLSSLFNQANRESTKNVMQGITAQGIKTFSGVFVPAALRQLDQFFDPKRYSPDDVQGMVLAQIPWARRNGHPDLNAFGQPVSSPTSKIFWSQVEGDALIRRLAGQRVFPGVPAEGDLTPEEHYALVKYRGPILREMLASRAEEWAGAPRLLAQDAVNRISSAATAKAKAELGLDEANAERRAQRKLTTK